MTPRFVESATIGLFPEINKTWKEQVWGKSVSFLGIG